CKRDTRGAHDLVGPHQALPVAGSKAQSAARVELPQPRAERGGAENQMELARLSPEFFRDFRNRRQTLFQRPDVKTGAADHYRQAPRGGGGGGFVPGPAAPTSK